LIIIYSLKLIVNGFLTKYIVFYNPEHILGYRIGTIPIEDFLFGFSMILMALIIWEKQKKI
jgi:lycopene cyclase domain-containing protein